MFARLLQRLAIPGAWLAALMFAVHPVCAESVAWISEQKNTLSTVFYLLSALAYLEFEDTRRPGSYVRASALFLIALGAKTVTATLPAALLVLAWWRRGRADWRRDVAPVVPWFIAGLLSGLFTAHVERTLIGARGEAFDLSMLDRGLIAGRVVWFYAAKLLWPADLIFIYPRWQIDRAALWQYLFPASVLAVFAALAWRAFRGRSRHARAPLAVALLFVGTLFPALGFVNVFPFIYSFVADHFQYLASLAVFAAAGAGMALACRRVTTHVAASAAVALLLGLAVLTHRELPMYHDNETLFRTTIARNPGCWMAYTNLADVLAATGRTDEAMALLNRALQVRPGYAEAENNLGEILNRLNRCAEAVPHLLRSLQLRPDSLGAHNNLGIAYLVLNRPDDGIHEFEKALGVLPTDRETHYNLAMALQRVGRMDEAMPHFLAAAGLVTNNPTAHANLAMALTLQNRYPEAFQHFERLIALVPDDPEPHVLYGRALLRAHQGDAALGQLRTAVQMNPRSVEYHRALATALRELGRVDEANDEEQRAARLAAH